MAVRERLSRAESVKSRRWAAKRDDELTSQGSARCSALI